MMAFHVRTASAALAPAVNKVQELASRSADRMKDLTPTRFGFRGGAHRLGAVALMELEDLFFIFACYVGCGRTKLSMAAAGSGL